VSAVWQPSTAPLWAVGGFYQDPEPFVYITQRGGTFQAEDVQDGPLGCRRTLEDAVALVEQHTARAAAEEAEHNVRVLAAIATLDQAA